MRDALTLDDLRFTPPRLPLSSLAPFLEDHWGVTGQFSPLSGERDQNFRVRAANGETYIYKVSSPIEDRALVDLQIQALLRIEQADGEIPVPRIVRSKRGNAFEIVTEGGEAHIVRLLSYVPGIPLERLDPPSVQTIAQIGALQGRLCRALAEFTHEAGVLFMPWDILNGLVISTELRETYLRDGLAQTCARFLDRLEHQSLPRMLDLPHQIIHNDAHLGNVMVDPDDPATVTGVIDFGDLVYRPIVVDLSTSLTSILDRSAAPIADAATLVRGFQRYLPLAEQQLELLYDAVVARAILTVELLQFRVEHAAVDPYTRDVDLPRCKAGLERILRVDEQSFHDAVLCPDRVLARLR